VTCGVSAIYIKPAAYTELRFGGGRGPLKMNKGKLYFITKANVTHVENSKEMYPYVLLHKLLLLLFTDSIV
jgi:hypothetical protein